MQETKLDPHNSQRKYKNWLIEAQTSGVNFCTPEDSKLIIEYSEDMRAGFNVGTGSKKGGRSYIRLLSLVYRLTSISYLVHKKYGEHRSIISLKPSELLRLFSSLREGELLNKLNKPLKDVDSVAKTYTSFYHWYQKRERAEGHELPDITIDLSKNGNKKGAWVYLTEQEIKQLAEAASPYHRALIYFVFDSGIRAPTELLNVKVSDIHEEADGTKLEIREEASKTFGRKIKLMFAGKIIHDFIRRENLANEDFLFKGNPTAINKYLKRLAKQLFGNSITKARGRYDQLTMYDLRHCSACYWMRRYKNQSGLMYRFGWKKQDMVLYYTEFLGLKDNITSEDMVIDVTVTELEKQLASEKERGQRQEDTIKALEERLQRIEDNQALQFLELLEKLEREQGSKLPASVPHYSEIVKRLSLPKTESSYALAGNKNILSRTGVEKGTE